MEQHGLITTLVAAIVLAFVFGFIAQRLRLAPIVGYLLAGFSVGPYSPGFTANLDLALQLSEIGVILLMFGIGLKISLDDIWAVRWVAAPGSLLQTIFVAALGAGVGLALNMPLAEAMILGVAVSVASTIVFLRVLEDRRLLKTEDGRISVSWLLVEDIVIILAIVILPALVAAMSGEDAQISPWRIAEALGVTIAKIGGFVALCIGVFVVAVAGAVDEQQHRAGGQQHGVRAGAMARRRLTQGQTPAEEGVRPGRGLRQGPPLAARSAPVPHHRRPPAPGVG